jgi:REP element-mobilizing transposase RayT
MKMKVVPHKTLSLDTNPELCIMRSSSTNDIGTRRSTLIQRSSARVANTGQNRRCSWLLPLCHSGEGQKMDSHLKCNSLLQNSSAGVRKSRHFLGVLLYDRLTVKRNSVERRVLWQRRCYDHNCRSETSVWETVEYCHQNPVKRGLAHAAGDWEWSSYRWYKGDRDVPMRMDLAARQK